MPLEASLCLDFQIRVIIKIMSTIASVMTILCYSFIQPQNLVEKGDPLDMDILSPHIEGYLVLWETYVEQSLEESFLENVVTYEEHNWKCLI